MKALSRICLILAFIVASSHELAASEENLSPTPEEVTDASFEADFQAETIIDCYKFWPSALLRAEFNRPPYNEPYRMNCVEILPTIYHPDSAKKLRAFHYTDGWSPDSRHVELIDSIRKALEKAPQFFFQYGPLPSIHVVITPEFQPNNKDVGATTYAFEEPLKKQPCLVRVFQDLLLNSPSKDFLQQSISHEIFHCFQYQNGITGIGTIEDNSYAWLREGSAVFFSNLVYPKANGEFDSTKLYDPTKSLLSQSSPYSTNLFFQALHNHISGGVASIMKLLKSMPFPTTFASQRKALSHFPKMNELLHHFAKDFYDNNIIDTGGGKVPLAHPILKEIVTIEAQSKKYGFEVIPFSLKSAILKLSPGGLYTFKFKPASTSKDHEKLSLKKVSGDRWDELTPEGVKVSMECKDKQTDYELAMTSISESTQPVPIVVEVTYKPFKCNCVETAQLDECLVGTWIVDPVAYVKNYREWHDKYFEDTVVTRCEVRGEQILEIKKTKEFTTTYKEFTTDADFKTSSGVDRWQITWKGTQTGKLFMEDSGKLCLKYDPTRNLAATVIINNGRPTPWLYIDTNINEGTYECSENKLVLRSAYQGNQAVPLELLRQSP